MTKEGWPVAQLREQQLMIRRKRKTLVLPQVRETAVSEKNNMTTGRHSVTIDLRLDISDRFGIGLQPSNIDLDIEGTIAAFQVIEAI